VKKIIYVLIVLLTVFSFNMEVDAASELTCMYNRELDTSQKVLLIQFSDGSRIAFKNEKKVTYHDYGWNEVNISHFEDGVLNANNVLDNCPTYVNTVDFSSDVYFFNEKKGLSGGQSLEVDPILDAILPPGVVTRNKFSSDLNKEQTCSGNVWLKDLDNSAYTGSCMYSKKIGDSCHLIQIDFGEFNYRATEYDFDKGFENSGIYMNANYYFKIEDLSLENILSNGGECLDYIQVSRESKLTCPHGGVCIPVNTSKVSFEKLKWDSYFLVREKGNNPLTGEELGKKTNIEYEKIDFTNCDSLFGDESEELKKLIKTIITIVKILIPFIIIALSGVDFAKVVLSGSEDDMKKTTKKFIKRLLIAVAIFLVPALLKVVLSISYNIWGILSPDFCGIL